MKILVTGGAGFISSAVIKRKQIKANRSNSYLEQILAGQGAS
ncbi:MAG: hypothetical protein ACTH6I_12660 [Vibrio litoralis]